MLDYLDSGKLVFASTVAMTLGKQGFKRLFDNFDFYSKVCTHVCSHAHAFRL
jgi:acetyl-CoA hydrolase